MKITLVFLATLLPAACNTIKIYTNENFMFKAKGLPPVRSVSADTCYVLEPHAMLPQEAVYVCSTRAVQKLLWWSQIRPEVAATQWIKEEAHKYGANIIRIVSEGWTSYSPYVLSTELYRLQEPALTVYRRRLDSLDEVNKHLVTVKIYNWIMRKKIPIYFNDSLMGTCPVPTVNMGKMVGTRSVPLQFQLATPGDFCVHAKRTDRCQSSAHVDLGKEYKLDIGDERAGYVLTVSVVPPSGRVLQ
jgi:hypothetical protein